MSCQLFFYHISASRTSLGAVAVCLAAFFYIGFAVLPIRIAMTGSFDYSFVNFAAVFADPLLLAIFRAGGLCCYLPISIITRYRINYRSFKPSAAYCAVPAFFTIFLTSRLFLNYPLAGRVTCCVFSAGTGIFSGAPAAGRNIIAVFGTGRRYFDSFSVIMPQSAGVNFCSISAYFAYAVTCSVSVAGRLFYYFPFIIVLRAVFSFFCISAVQAGALSCTHRGAGGFFYHRPLAVIMRFRRGGLLYNSSAHTAGVAL